VKKYLVTGGAGFIGANLVRRLVQQQVDVHIFATEQESLWRLHGIEEYVTVHRVDLCDYKKVQQLIEQTCPTTIFHLASYGGMPDQLDQKAIFDVNFFGTVNLFNACKNFGFDCFVNTGSSSEYGMKQGPMCEDDVLEPVSDYAVAKAAATQFCLKEALKEKLPVYTIRPFSVYGPYEMKTRLIPTVLLGALEQKELHLSSPGCVRDFVYVDDVVDMYMMVAQQKPRSEFIFNAGSGRELSVGDVVTTVQDIIQKTCLVAWGRHQKRPWEPEHWVASVERAHSVLGWRPRYTLAQGLHTSLIWFEHNRHLYEGRQLHVPHTEERHYNPIAR